MNPLAKRFYQREKHEGKNSFSKSLESKRKLCSDFDEFSVTQRARIAQVYS